MANKRRKQAQPVRRARSAELEEEPQATVAPPLIGRKRKRNRVPVGPQLVSPPAGAAEIDKKYYFVGSLPLPSVISELASRVERTNGDQAVESYAFLFQAGEATENGESEFTVLKRGVGRDEVLCSFDFNAFPFSSAVGREGRQAIDRLLTSRAVYWSITAAHGDGTETERKKDGDHEEKQGERGQCQEEKGNGALLVSVFVSKSLVDRPLGEELPVLPRKQQYRDCRHLMKLLYPSLPIFFSSSDDREGPTPSSFSFHPPSLYESVRAPSVRLPQGEVLHTPPQLIPTLRPYQQAAVKWMLEREGGGRENVKDGLESQGKEGRQDGEETDSVELLGAPVWFSVGSSRKAKETSFTRKQDKDPMLPSRHPEALSGRERNILNEHKETKGQEEKGLFYSPYTGVFRTSLPGPLRVSRVQGGILADEMGLGKTVETLALVLFHQWQGEGREEEAAEGERTERKKKENGALDTVQKGDKREENRKDSKAEGPEDLTISEETDEALESRGRGKKCAAISGNSARRKRKENQKDNYCICGQEVDFESQNIVCCERCQVPQHLQCSIYGDESVGFAPQGFTCLPCLSLRSASPRRCGATLIVTPTAILEQWIYEITRHTIPGAVKIAVYEGVKHTIEKARRDPEALRYLDPRLLAKYDVVITTYDYLRADLYHTDTEVNKKALRYSKRYRPVPTPLLALSWWRVCLDECQMVESTSAKVAEMALRLQTKHRWCISGTPIKNGLDDLYGLLVFLRVSPFNDRGCWEHIMKKNYERDRPEYLLSLLREIMWRNNKKDVIDQVKIPPQTEKIVRLRFAPVEAHFYRKQEEECAKLRQACCHPQVGSSGLRSLQHTPMSMEQILDQMITRAKTECEEEQRQLVGALNGLAALCTLRSLPLQAASCYREALTVIESNAPLFRVDDLQKLHIYHNLGRVLKDLERRKGASFSILNVPSFQAGEGLMEEIGEETAKDLIIDMTLDGRDDGEQAKEGASSSSLSLAKMTTPSANAIDSASLAVSTAAKGSDEREKSTPAGKRNQGPHSVENGKQLRHDNQTGVGSERTGVHLEICRLETLERKLRDKYVGQAQLKLQIAAAKHSQTSADITSKFSKNHSEQWWVMALDALHGGDVMELMERVRREIGGKEYASLSLCFSEDSGFRFVLHGAMKKLVDSRERALITLNQLNGQPTAEQVRESGQCRKCRAGRSGRECFQCKARAVLDEYDACLHAYRRQQKDGGGAPAASSFAVDDHDGRDQSLRESEEEEEEDAVGEALAKRGKAFREDAELIQILKVLHRSLRAAGGKRSLLEAGTKQLELFQEMQKEIGLCTQLWMAQHERLSALDEVDMAVITIRLAQAGEKVNEADRGFIIQEPEIPVKTSELKTDRIVAAHALEKARRQLCYLQNLSQARKGGRREDTCAICLHPVDKDSVLLPCVHSFCFQCFSSVFSRHRKENKGGVYTSPRAERREEKVRCPTCRQVSVVSEVLALREEESQRTASGSEEVKGSFGTKINSVIRTLFSIQKEEPEAKSIIFSQWDDMLRLLADALTANDLPHARIVGSRSFDRALKAFRRPLGQEGAVNILLIPIRSGANGLNLIEARHVLVLEPVLSPGIMAQAINRVHRLGQTKPTFVYRFLVEGTIEERIYELEQRRARSLSQGLERWRAPKKDNEAITLADLKALVTGKETLDDSMLDDGGDEEGTQDLDPRERRDLLATAAEWRLRGNRGGEE